METNKSLKEYRTLNANCSSNLNVPGTLIDARIQQETKQTLFSQEASGPVNKHGDHVSQFPQDCPILTVNIKIPENPSLLNKGIWSPEQKQIPTK